MPKLLRTCNCNSELGHCINSDIPRFRQHSQHEVLPPAAAHGALAKLAKFQLSTFSKLSCTSQRSAAPLFLCRACSASVGQPRGRLECFIMLYQPGFKDLRKVHSYQYCCAMLCMCSVCTDFRVLLGSVLPTLVLAKSRSPNCRLKLYSKQPLFSIWARVCCAPVHLVGSL